MSNMSEQSHINIGVRDEDSLASDHPLRGLILKRAKFLGSSFFILLMLGAAATIALRVAHGHVLRQSNVDENRLFVITTNAKPAGKSMPLTLPGTLQGIIESPIYARSNGYVLRWNVDIGAHVNKGDILAEIDTPEVDQQLSQAIAAKQQAAASLELAKSSAERWQALRKRDAVTQQELDERSSAYTQAQANFSASEANVKRLQKLEDFKNVIAPFSGVVTNRFVNVGDLINAGNGGAGRSLFTLAQIDPLRVYVYVPQAYAHRIKVGDEVSVTQAELSGQVFHGTVVRASGAIDAATRTLQIEVNLPNRENKLLAGSYVQVALPVGASNGLTIPANAVLFRPEGTRIAVVSDDGHIKLHSITIGNDLGSTLEILNGVTPTDKIVLNPADSLADNDVVTIAKAQTADAGKKAAP